MVTGGNGGSYLDSTEIYRDNVWRTAAGKLPFKMLHHRVASVNNRVLIIGTFNINTQTCIYIDKSDWLQVVDMMENIKKRFLSSTMRLNLGLRLGKQKSQELIMQYLSYLWMTMKNGAIKKFELFF